MTKRVRIKRIVKRWDMHKIHALRFMARNLYSYEVLLAFNSKRTMFRMVDSTGGVYQNYAPEGETFDMEAIQKIMREGLQVDIAYRQRTSKNVKLVA
jgi:hypothetical protein